ncbi:nuclear receptor subfamily 1 group i member 3 [Lynx pardinus]|uniref:Nuclear receptor subfamily 1 group i member 3 n=1 Tax=Lynx pardinus TaxID=191816 RepID=A0A485MQV8_LYNPA|nr:nuclear receptor subfamily 1 group i member 3 [Lynx pardinus]
MELSFPTVEKAAGGADFRKRVRSLCSDKSKRSTNYSSGDSSTSCWIRTVTRSTGLTCPFAGRCEVNKIQRRHCPACRLQKCLDAGMKKDSELAPPNTSIHGPGLSALPLVPQRVRHTRRVETSPTMLLFRPKPQRLLVRLTVRDPTILSLLLLPPGSAHHGHTQATQCLSQTHPSGPVCWHLPSPPPGICLPQMFTWLDLSLPRFTYSACHSVGT